MQRSSIFTHLKIAFDFSFHVFQLVILFAGPKKYFFNHFAEKIVLETRLTKHSYFCMSIEYTITNVLCKEMSGTSTKGIMSLKEIFVDKFIEGSNIIIIK